MWLEDLVRKHKVLCKGGGSELFARTAEGKEFIGLYFSAHWCPPCRAFTPQLAQWYRKQSRAEIIFISSDNDEAAFQEYFGEMPWKALPFNPKLNEILRDRFSVQGIPTLVILDARSGEIITDDARGDIKDHVDSTFSQWTPEAVQEKKANKRRAKQQLRKQLPVIVRAELEKIRLVGRTDRTMLAELLAKVATQEFGKALPKANLEHAVAEMIETFEDKSHGIITPDDVARKVCEWLEDVSDPEAVAHYLKPQTVREMAIMRFLDAALEEAKLDAEWSADGVTVQQCKAIFTKFDQDGDGRLLEGEFKAFLQGTLAEELKGLYEHLVGGVEYAERGVEAKQLYTFVYRKVFVGRREGDAAAQISKDHSTLFAPRGKL